MEALRVQLLDEKLAKAPSHNADRSYTIYSAENHLLKSGERCVINTGILLSCPPNTYPMFFSGELSVSNNIETHSYTSYQYGSFPQINPLTISITNNGKKEYRVMPGDPVARMVLLRIEPSSVQVVSDITEKPEKTTDLKSYKEKRATLAPPSAVTWFKEQYVADTKRTTELYIPSRIREAIKQFETTDDYQQSNAKELLVAAYVWKMFNAKEKARVQTAFDSLQQTTTGKKAVPTQGTQLSSTHTNGKITPVKKPRKDNIVVSKAEESEEDEPEENDVVEETEDE